MKKLLFFLLVPFVAFGQHTRDEYLCKFVGKPTIVSVTKNALSIDCTNKQVWIATSNTVSAWSLVTDVKVIERYFPALIPGPKGDKGDPGISVTGPQGPKGNDGVCPPCPPGGGTQVFPFIVVVAYGSQTTLQQAGIPVSNYPGTDVTLSDMVDRATMQYAVKQQESSKKRIICIGDMHWWNRGVKAGKYQKVLDIDLANNALNATNSNVWSFFFRDLPTDMNDANVMIMTVWNIYNGKINGVGKAQIGIECQATYGSGIGSRFEFIEFAGLKTGIHTYFSLNCFINHPSFTDCFNGAIVDNYTGKVPGATPANSQGNCTHIIQPRYYGDSGLMQAIRAAYPDSIRYKKLEAQFSFTPDGRTAAPEDIYSKILAIADNMRVTSGGGVAIGIYSASSCVVDGLICEGFSVAAAIDFDGMGATTVKDLMIRNYIHFECVKGASDAIVKFRILGGNVVMENPINHYPAILLDAGVSTGGGYMTADISGMNWYVPKNGKLFNNANNVGFNLRNCENVGTSAQISAMVSGTATQPCDLTTPNSCGANYIRVLQPRR